MLSLRELRRAALILEGKLAGSILQRVVQVDDFKLTLAFRKNKAETFVLFSCRHEFARVALSQELPRAPDLAPSFAQYLKANLLHASFGGIHLADMDRQASVQFFSREGSFELILSILGPRSNVYLLNQERKVVLALRPLEETRRELSLGGPWSNPQSALRSEGMDRWESVPDDEYFSAIDQYYSKLEHANKIESLSRKIQNAMNREESFLGRKAVNLQEDLGRARQAEEYKRKGELLKTVLHSIQPGDSSVTATDYATQETITIPLDATLSPAGNLEAYFGRYQKELRGVAAIEEQLQSVRRAQTAWEERRGELHRLLNGLEPDLAMLEDFAARPQIRKMLVHYSPRQKPGLLIKSAGSKKDVPARLLPKRYRTPDGLEVWVGRNDESNDYLTTRLARGNDLFFHLEGYPGSHVILRTEGRTDPSSESMLAACELAVHFSKLKNANRADVHVACVKDVKKPKGVKKGLVYVTRGKTIYLRRDPKRLEDILSSRLDE